MPPVFSRVAWGEELLLSLFWLKEGSLFSLGSRKEQGVVFKRVSLLSRYSFLIFLGEFYLR